MVCIPPQVYPGSTSLESIAVIWGWDSGPDYEYRDCMASPALGNGRIWWWYDREIISQLPALCEGDPPVIGGFPSQFTTGGFPSQRARYALPDLGNTGTWWQNDMEMISTLLALCEGNHWWLVDFPHKFKLVDSPHRGIDMLCQIWVTQGHDDRMTWKWYPHYWPFVWRNPPATGGFPSQRASNPPRALDNTGRMGQIGWYFADDIFICILLKETICEDPIMISQHDIR